MRPVRAPAISAGDRLEAAVRALRDAFRKAALDSPDLDARLLVREVVGLDLTGLVREGARPLREDEAAAIAAAAARRLRGEPVARILGRQEFWGLTFRLGPDALVPRPDTETLVEAVLQAIDGAAGRDTRLVVADIGTGSGAILAALLAELPNAVGLGIDLAPGALAVAAENLAALGLADRALLVRGSYGAALAPGGFDVVVSNPPYIESADIAGLMTEVRDHDPRLALDGGPDGLDAYRAIAAQAPAALRSGGFLAVEIGWRQAEAVRAILVPNGFKRIDVLPDLAGNDRVLRAFLP
ncbi:peptide chain release factor N(5)-glutamine methyltransferase [Prosthecomicrobium sp. N25]|uniref:peptide chain release factor N(5)-glutamine methyltransferase n=1 Tax=Prosthecomicrobium sp. N25 TaxID=3129254 RepID=UPI003076C3A6